MPLRAVGGVGQPLGLINGGRNGRPFAPGDAAALRKMLEELVAEPETRQRLGKAACASMLFPDAPESSWIWAIRSSPKPSVNDTASAGSSLGLAGLAVSLAQPLYREVLTDGRDLHVFSSDCGQ